MDHNSFIIFSFVLVVACHELKHHNSSHVFTSRLETNVVFHGFMCVCENKICIELLLQQLNMINNNWKSMLFNLSQKSHWNSVEFCNLNRNRNLLSLMSWNSGNHNAYHLNWMKNGLRVLTFFLHQLKVEHHKVHR